MALYEGMFLISNDAVRADWASAKSIVTDLIAKHGGSVQTARRWDERQLAYPIQGRYRATYLLSFFEMHGDSIPAFHRELEIKEDVLRYLQLRAEVVPEGEAELTEAEGASDFSVPEPPKEEAPPIAPELLARPREERRDAPRRDAPAAPPAEEAEKKEAAADEGAAEAPAEAPAAATPEAAPAAAAADTEETKES